jgi:hypothetical protein
MHGRRLGATFMRFSNGIGLVGLASVVGAGCGGPSPTGTLSLTVSAPGANGGTGPLSGAAVAVDTADGARH